MAYGFPENGRLPSSSHLGHPWRIHEIVPDFRLEDVWALPVEGDADEFSDLLELVGSLRPGEDSAAARFLWQLRDRLGAWFGIGRISTAAGQAQPATPPPVPGTGEPSLAGRVPADLRDTTAGFDFGTLPFTPLYRTADEAAAEVSNQTVYGVAHLGWAEQEDGRYQGRMAVYVKPRGLFGEAYMGLIKPFRYLVVYPALMRQLEREWEERPARRLEVSRRSLS